MKREASAAAPAARAAPAVPVARTAPGSKPETAESKSSVRENVIKRFFGSKKGEPSDGGQNYQKGAKI